MKTISGGGTGVDVGEDVGTVVAGGIGSAVHGGDGVVTTAAANPNAAAGPAKTRINRWRRLSDTAPPSAQAALAISSA